MKKPKLPKNKRIKLIKKLLTKEWKPTYKFCNSGGEQYVTYMLLQEMLDEGKIEKLKINKATFWKLK